MKLVEINLVGVTLENVRNLCISLSERYEGCTVYKTIGYWSDDTYQIEVSYEGIRQEQGYGIKVLTEEEDLNRMEKVLRTELKDTSLKWVQVVSYEVKTNHLELKGESCV